MIFQLVQKTQWGCSAAGSAREWHSRGRGFNPRQLHQNDDRTRDRGGFRRGCAPFVGSVRGGGPPQQESVRDVSDSNRLGSAVQSPPAPPNQASSYRRPIEDSLGCSLAPTDKIESSCCTGIGRESERGSIPASSTDTMLDNLTLINSGLRREWAFPLVMRLPPPSL